MLHEARYQLHQIRLFFDPLARKKELSYILEHAPANGLLSESIHWFESLVEWICASTPLPTDFDSSTGQLPLARLRFMLQVLERHPHWKKNVAKAFRVILDETSGTLLFSQTGLVQEKGFFSEIATRILRKFLPAPPHEKNLAELFSHIFKDPDDTAWIAHLSPEVTKQIISVIKYEAPTKDVFHNVNETIHEAVLILSAQTAAVGLSSEIRERLPTSSKVSQSPFLHLSEAVKQNKIDEAHRQIWNCRQIIQGVFSHLEESGVSVGLVYNLEMLQESLNRIEVLLKLLEPHGTDDVNVLSISFLASLAQQSVSNRSLMELLQSNLHLLSRKIIERTGDSGEHYITQTKSEYFHMLLSAMGGGLLTVGTTVFKFGINKLQLPLFFEGFFSWANYSGSFLLMQAFQFTLATKQPSMTASALAGKLTHLHVHEFVNEVACITRSQFAAILGNIGLVIPGAVLVDMLNVNLAGNHILGFEYAEYVLESLHPFKSLTLPLAALTGAILWTSSIASGWVENWIVYRQLPLAIARHRTLNRLLSVERCEKISHWFSHNVAGVGGNISLGFLLAFTPITGRFFGLPLDVRHVTLSTGALTFAVCTLTDYSLNSANLVWSIVGIFFIGLLNFGVSFVLALIVAIRARNIDQSRVRLLMKSTLARLRQKPWEFLLPPRS